MHCDADLTNRQPVAPDAVASGSDSAAADEDGSEIGTIETTSGNKRTGSLFDPEGFVDDTLTALIGIVTGVVVGIVGFFVLLGLTESGWSVFGGVVIWLGASAYLVRRRTVEEAIAKSGYAVALVLLLVPLVAFSPTTFDGGLVNRAETFLVLLVIAAIPAGVAAGIGWFASRFVPEDLRAGEG